MIDVLDPRIHFAPNCTSNSCPSIGVYIPDMIDQQLDLAARSFINADTVLDLKKSEISISRIFSWYAVDFGGKAGILQSLEKYLVLPERTYQYKATLSNLALRYHPYDWGLNKLS